MPVSAQSQVFENSPISFPRGYLVAQANQLHDLAPELEGGGPVCLGGASGFFVFTCLKGAQFGSSIHVLLQGLRQRN